MKKKHNYVVQIVKDVQEDLSYLPLELQKKWQQYQKILAIDPYQVLNLPSHDLTGKLRGCRAIEIENNGIAYRLVYKICEKPSPKRVVILSFAEHNPAYKNAKKRK